MINKFLSHPKINGLVGNPKLRTPTRALTSLHYNSKLPTPNSISLDAMA